MKDRKHIAKLVKQASILAAKHRNMLAEINEYLVEKYGCSYNEVNDDWTIDALDYGIAHTTLSDIEKKLKKEAIVIDYLKNKEDEK